MMDASFAGTALLRLLLAAVLGAAVGLERETKRKPAGLRTLILVTMGSALFTICSEAIARIYGGDSTRIASNIATGIGFLGAGAILHARGAVIGLTTAASIFAMAAVGMAAGAGLSLIAGGATLVLLAVLVLLGRIEKVTERQVQLLTWSLTTGRPDVCVDAVMEYARSHRLAVSDLRVDSTGMEARVEFCIEAVAGEESETIRKLQELSRPHA